MALLSPKNFVIPFSNKVHVATIVFVVVLFAAFRAMGGAFSLRSEPGAQRLRLPTNIPSQTEDVTLDDQQDNVDADVTLEGRRFNNDEVTGTVRTVPRVEATAKQVSPAANDLDEIMRRLDGR